MPIYPSKLVGPTQIDLCLFLQSHHFGTHRRLCRLIQIHSTYFTCKFRGSNAPFPQMTSLLAASFVYVWMTYVGLSCPFNSFQFLFVTDTRVEHFLFSSDCFERWWCWNIDLLCGEMSYIAEEVLLWQPFTGIDSIPCHHAHGNPLKPITHVESISPAHIHPRQCCFGLAILVCGIECSNKNQVSIFVIDDLFVNTSVSIKFIFSCAYTELFLSISGSASSMAFCSLPACWFLHVTVNASICLFSICA